MKRENTVWNSAEGEGSADERLPDRSTRFVEKLMAKLARHNRDAEHLAQAMDDQRKSGVS